LPILKEEMAGLIARPGGSSTVEVRIRHKNGSWRWLEATGSNSLHKDTINAIVVNYRDITERKAANEALRNSEHRFRALIENSSDAIAIITKKGLISYISPSATKITGFSVQEFQEQLSFDFIHAEDKKSVLSLFNHIVSQPRGVVRTEFRVSHKEGGWFWVECTASNFLEEPAVGGIVLNFHNIHDRKKVEDALRISEEQYRSVVTAMSEGIVVQDSAGLIRTCNASAEKILGLTRDQMMWRTSSDSRWYAIHEDGTPFPGEAHPAMHTLKTGESCSNVTMGIHKPDGTLTWLSINSQPLFHPGITTPYAVVTSFTDITERKRAEERIRTSESNLKEAQRMAKLGSWELDLAHHALVWSDEVFRIFELDALHFQPSYETFLKAVHPDDRQRVDETYTESIRCKAPYHFEHRLLMSDGRVKYVTEQGHTFYAPDDTPLRTVGTIQDITERKKADEALRISEQKFRDIFNFAPVGIYQSKSDGTIITANQALADILGYASVEDVVQVNLENDIYAHREDRKRLIEQNEGKGYGREIEVQWKKKDGSPIWVHLDVHAVVDSRGRTQYFEGFVRDITDLKKGMETLRLQTTALQSAANAISITNCQGTIISINPAFSRLTGYDATEVIGNDHRMLNSGKQSKAFYENLWETILSGKVWNGELVNKRKDGNLYTEEMTVTPVRNADNTISHFVAIKQDITERKNLQEQVNQAQKMESIGRLAGGIAHDFNNILGIILAYATLFRHKVPKPEDLVSGLDIIINAVQRGAGLVRQILTFARKTEVSLSPVDVNESIGEIRKMIVETFPKTIELRFNLASQMPRVLIDSGQLYQAVLNLCVNARDAVLEAQKMGRADSRIEISTFLVPAAKVRTSHLNAASDEYVGVSITDTGTGMDEATKSRIFEPFFTTKEKGKGTGLGLAVVYGVVQSMNGFVDVQSSPGKGTSFTLYIPTAHDPGREGQVRKQVSGEIRGGHETLLVVEDEESLLTMLQAMLQDHGYQVIGMKNGIDALEQYRKHIDDVALVITDLDIPGLDGGQLLHELKSLNPGVA
ncbi:MAG TPA: PAS domain S-box protein, partial [Bacteroidota bacterium]